MARNFQITPEDELAEDVEPLTEEEIRWIASLQRILEKCPKRLELVTTGDPGLLVLDGPASVGRDLHDGLAEESGLTLAILSGGPTVHGVSG